MAKAKQPIPEGYHSITPTLTFKDASQAIEFYKRAFGAVENYRMTDTDGTTVIHAELKIGDSVFMLGTECEMAQSAETLKGSPVSFYIYVKDADQEFTKAVESGAQEQEAVSEQFWGDRMGTISDPFGYRWSIATRVEDLNEEEIQERAKAFLEKRAAA